MQILLRNFDKCDTNYSLSSFWAERSAQIKTCLILMPILRDVAPTEKDDILITHYPLTAFQVIKI